MNDWQLLYEGTHDVTPAALLSVARLRLALAAGAVTEDQVQAALAHGTDSIGELLETIGAAEDAAAGGELQVEDLEESFSPFGRLV